MASPRLEDRNPLHVCNQLAEESHRRKPVEFTEGKSGEFFSATGLCAGLIEHVCAIA